MAKLQEAEKGLFFFSVIYNQDSFNFGEVEEVLSRRYDLSGHLHPQLNPSLDYYSKEMGKSLERVLFWSNQKFSRSELIEGKLWADQIEQETSFEGARTINLDAGMIFKEQLLLATSKPYSHRIYLRDGVWAELNYKYENKSYHFLPWTYPDYRCEEKIKFFNSLRLGLFSN